MPWVKPRGEARYVSADAVVSNAGAGDGGEGIQFGNPITPTPDTEDAPRDQDPGNSGLNNQAPPTSRAVKLPNLAEWNDVSEKGAAKISRGRRVDEPEWYPLTPSSLLRG